MEVFPARARPDQRRDFLWREMEQRGAFLILSARAPVDRHALFELDEPKSFAPALAAGDRLGFSLRANPVVRRRDPSRRRSMARVPRQFPQDRDAEQAHSEH